MTTTKTKRRRRTHFTWKRCRLRLTKAKVKETSVAKLIRWHAIEGRYAVVRIQSTLGRGEPARWLAVQRLAKGEVPIPTRGTIKTPGGARRVCEAHCDGTLPRKRARKQARLEKYVEGKSAARPIGREHSTPVEENDMSKKKAAAKTKAAKKPKASLGDRVEKAAKAKAPKADGKLSLIDAAAQVLKGAAEPMNAKQLVDAVVEKKLWTPGAGKTPHATLAAAIITEMGKKGKDSRFTRPKPGHFALA